MVLGSSASFVCSMAVRFQGFFSSAKRVCFSARRPSGSSTVLTSARRTSSSASCTNRCTWKRSKMVCAFFAASDTAEMYACDMSIVTAWSNAHRSGPSSSRNARRVSAFLPSRAQTTRPVTWSTTMVTYLWCLRYESSSTPMCVSPSSLSPGRSRATRRTAIEPTVAHALLKYVLRPPIAQERVVRGPDGLVRIALKRVFSDGTTAIDMD
ncbi:MAG TPA: hypothetical protein VF316_18270, partial [Polyangiaceae bacterium]